MDWDVWARVEAALRERDLRPILAVVPDNQDANLQVRPPAKDFWERVRGWQSLGWTIGLHGYQHRYVSRRRGMVTARRKSEFAGLPAAAQRDKLRRATDIFRGHGIHARVRRDVAPAAAADAATLALTPATPPRDARGARR